MKLQTEQSHLWYSSLPWKVRICAYMMGKFMDITRRSNGRTNKNIIRLADYLVKTPPNPNPIQGVKTSDIIVDPSRNLWFRLFIPTQKSNDQFPIIVFFHGGGFLYSSADNILFDTLCRSFARAGPAVVVSVNYRRTPEHRYPAQYEDGFDVLNFLDNEKDRVLPSDADLAKCFLAGDSAGGNIAHHVAKRASQSKFNHLKVIGLVALQPFFGGEERTKSEIELGPIDPLIVVERTDWMWKAFMPPGSGMDRDHEVVNVSGHRAAQISNLDFPATMVVVGGFDSLKDWQKRYYEWLDKSGKEAYLVEYPNMIHGFYCFSELPETGLIISQIKKFVQDQCSKVVN